MCGALSSRWAIAGLVTLLCFSTARLAESTVPSGSFTIKEGAVLGTFDVTGAQRNIHLTTGLTYSITCEAGEVPGPAPQWYRDGSAVEKREDSAVCGSLTEVFYKDDVDNSNQWVLTLCNFDTTLAGSFTCRPSSNYNKTLIVREGNPSVVVDRDVIVSDNFGAGTLVGIFLSGIPTPAPVNVTWLFNGAMLGLSSVAVTANGALSFDAFGPINAGEYTCIVTTSAGVGMDSLRVQIRARPDLSLSVEYNSDLITSGPIEVLHGANLTLSCIDRHAFPSPSFQWSSNGAEISNTDLSTSVETIGNNQSQLALYNVQEGSFTLKCTATNSVGSRSRMITVSVLTPPSLTRITPQETSGLVGHNLTLLLIFNGGHTPLTAQWSRITTNGVNELIADGGRVILDGQHSVNLTITDLVLSDEGVYQLSVTNQIGSSIFKYTVHVYDRPTVNNISPLTKSVPPNSPYTVTAHVTGGTPPVQEANILWSTTPTTQGSSSFTGSVASLNFSNLSSPVLVTLTVQHPSGNLTVLFNISIQQPPSPPENVSLQQISPCTVVLSWDLGQMDSSQSAPADQIVVEQASNDTSPQNWEKIRSVPPSDTNVTIDLNPDQILLYRVTAVSEVAGKSDPVPADRLANSTVKGFSPAVNKLTMLPTSATSIRLRWAPPSSHDCYEIVGYNITCRNSATSRGMTSKTVTTLSVTNLSPNTSYRCSVKAKIQSKGGVPVDFDASPTGIDSYTLPLPPNRPSRPEVSTFTHDSIILDLSTIKKDPSVSLVQIVVVRLPTDNNPHGSPETLYPNNASFSTYEDVHSSGDNYRPYIAAELNANELGDTFVIGEDTDNRKRSNHNIRNGPLSPSSFYTCFLRVYSSWIGGQTSPIHNSSVFMFPVVETMADKSSPGSLNAATVAVPILLLIVILAAIGIVLAAVFYFRYRMRKGEPEISSKHESATGNDYEFYKPAELLPAESFAPSSPTSSQQPPLSPLSEKPGTPKCTLALQNKTFFEMETDSPPNALPSPISSEPAESSIMGTESHTQSHPPSEPPCTFDDLDDSSSVHECPNSWMTDTLGSVRSLAESKPVAQEAFHDHVLRMNANEQERFRRQFRNLRMPSFQHSCEASKLPENKKKNRYKDIFAFDRTRVKLNCESEQESDYINANFVPGFNRQKIYIAAQGPMECTMVDFWQMVWEQKTATIVMLANLFENGKLKCYQYWPNEGSRDYGAVTVTLETTIELQYYSIRSLKVTSSGKQRRILQFHYTGWPDKNVPALAGPLLDFLRAINSWNSTDLYGPMVIHCSAGVGRTGTIIALDICLDQLLAERVVDVMGVVRELRENRNDMVQVPAQYIFLHHALLEAIVYGDSSVLLKNFPDHYRQLCATSLESSFMGSVTITTTAAAAGNSSVPEPIRNEFDRIGKVHLPQQYCIKPTKILIDGQFDSEMPVAEFNAHFIDGDSKGKQFIASDSPVGYTCVEQFWCLVWEQRCSHIVMLTPNDSNKSTAYLPKMGIELIVGRLHVKTDRPKTMAGYISQMITIECDDGTSHTLRHMQYRDWLTKHFSRPVDKFVRFVQECLRESEHGKHLLIHDDGSMGPVGVFLALSHCIQRLEKEGIVDLLQTVNRLHLQRSGLVTSVQLYYYCYECLNDLSRKLLDMESRTNESIYENIRAFKPSPATLKRKEKKVRKYLKDYDIIDC